MMNEPAEQNDLAILRQILDMHFDEGELRTLCFDLAIDYESLPGIGKADKARELVSYCFRHNRLPELKDVCCRARPDISWDNLLSGHPQDPALQFGQDADRGRITQVATGTVVAQAAGPQAAALVTIEGTRKPSLQSQRTEEGPGINIATRAEGDRATAITILGIPIQVGLSGLLLTVIIMQLFGYGINWVTVGDHTFCSLCFILCYPLAFGPASLFGLVMGIGQGNKKNIILSLVSLLLSSWIIGALILGALFRKLGK